MNSHKSTNYKAQKKYRANNPEVVKECYAKYNKKKPSWGFRPQESLLEWLESQRHEKETNSALLNRLLFQLKDSA